MYGLIGKIKATSGQREALISILLEGVAGMPDCLSYVVAQDPTDQDAIWVTEVWISQNSRYFIGQTNLSVYFGDCQP